MQKINIVIASDSFLIAKGLFLLLNEMRNASVQNSVDEYEELLQQLKEGQTNLLIITSGFATKHHVKSNDIFKISKGLKVFGIDDNLNPFPDNLSLEFKCNVFDNKDVIHDIMGKMFDNIFENNDELIENSELSVREKNVLKHVAMGLSNKEIAEKLFISQHTAITHRKNITRKLGIKTISGLTVYAIINGLLGMEDIEK